MIEFFVSYGSQVPVTVAVWENGDNPNVAAASSGDIEGSFRAAYKRAFGKNPDVLTVRSFLSHFVRQKESRQAQPQSVGL